MFQWDLLLKMHGLIIPGWFTSHSGSSLYFEYLHDTVKKRFSYEYSVSNVFIILWLQIVIALCNILAHAVVKMQVMVSVAKNWVIFVIQFKRQGQFIRQVRQAHLLWFRQSWTQQIKLHCSQNHMSIFYFIYSACSDDNVIHFTLYISSHDLPVNLPELFCNFSSIMDNYP